jgi:hypothetical protein
LAAGAGPTSTMPIADTLVAGCCVTAASAEATPFEYFEAKSSLETPTNEKVTLVADM